VQFRLNVVVLAQIRQTWIESNPSMPLLTEADTCRKFVTPKLVVSMRGHEAEVARLTDEIGVLVGEMLG